ncbi:MAG: DUF3887 domain-containing protein [Oscillospiraceae bacterium]|nr:DUF3887 domain-containing protein [Oscillospiraceae bacterium]
MKKGMLRACALLSLLALLLSGCGSKLPEGFAQADVEAAAKQTVALVNAGDYDGLFASLRGDVQELIKKEDIETAFRSVLDKAGAFVDYKKITLAGTKGASGEEYAVAAVACTYENATVTYTLSYDADYALVGLYIK